MSNKHQFANRFIMDSDIMTLAQVSNGKAIVTIPAGRAEPSVGSLETVQAALKSVNGAIARYNVTYETTYYDADAGAQVTGPLTFPVESSFVIWSRTGYPKWTIFLERLNKDTLSVVAFIDVNGTPGTFVDYPSLTFTIEACYLYPPNI